jgi:hypothetical protein
MRSLARLVRLLLKENQKLEEISGVLNPLWGLGTNPLSRKKLDLLWIQPKPSGIQVCLFQQKFAGCHVSRFLSTKYVTT